MTINEQLQPLVQTMVDEIKLNLESDIKNQIHAEVVKQIATLSVSDELDEIKDKISDELLEQITSERLNNIVTEVAGQQIDQRLKKVTLEKTTQEQLDSITQKIKENFEKNITKTAEQSVKLFIEEKTKTVDFQKTLENIVEGRVRNSFETLKFPEKGIKHSMIDFNGFTITGDNIKGGIQQKFGSTGIEDISTTVQMTLMDHATAFESELWAQAIKTVGHAEIGGNLTVKGTLDESSPMFEQLQNEIGKKVLLDIDESIFTRYAQLISQQINEKGIDLNKITHQGKEVVKGKQLGYHITESNLQRVGVLNDLQTRGESYLSQTLYTTKDRVGVNTMEPSTTFVVWDEECEMVVCKKKQNTAYFGTHRNQEVIIGSNSKDNIRLDGEGRTHVKNLTLNDRVSITSSGNRPTYEGKMADIIFNEIPSVGKPVGWVCLGGSKWAPFGTIE